MGLHRGVCGGRGTHEYGLIEDIVALASNEARARGGTVRAVQVQIGELAGTDPEALAAAFEALSRGTALEGASLVLATTPGLLACGACGFRGSAQEAGLDEHRTPPWVCPTCGYLLAAAEGHGVRYVGLVPSE